MLRLTATTNLENKNRETTTGSVTPVSEVDPVRLFITPLDLVKKNFLTELNKLLCQSVEEKVSQKLSSLRKPSKMQRPFNLTCLEQLRTLVKANPREMETTFTAIKVTSKDNGTQVNVFKVNQKNVN